MAGHKGLEQADPESAMLLLPHRHSNAILRKSRQSADPHLPFSVARDVDSQEARAEAIFVVKNTRVLARLVSDGIELQPIKGQRYCICGNFPQHILYSDILSVTLIEKLPILMRMWRRLWRKHGGAAIAVNLICRPKKQPMRWSNLRLYIVTDDPAIARGWVAEIDSTIAVNCANRPSRVLVLINSKSGSCKADKVWAKTAQPILHRAGVEAVEFRTQYAGHAQKIIASLPQEELKSYEGFLAVGGDGLFQEVVHGYVKLQEDSRTACAVEGIRLAQIPAGSTDAVAWSLNGTRSAEAAALHVAVGDSCDLDVMRVDSGDGATRYSVCYAAYGYMGDLMRRSESMRWLGPLRYAIAGVLTFIQCHVYSVSIAYVPCGTPGPAPEKQCLSNCEICAFGVEVARSRIHSAAAGAFEESNSCKLQGRFRSIMAIVTPCRSDLSPFGLSPYSHLADGRIRLILVGECSSIAYLQFLASIPKGGIRPENFDFVRVLDVKALRVTPTGKESNWNVDGELLSNNVVDSEIHRRHLKIFARGIASEKISEYGRQS